MPFSKKSTFYQCLNCFKYFHNISLTLRYISLVNRSMIFMLYHTSFFIKTIYYWTYVGLHYILDSDRKKYQE